MVLSWNPPLSWFTRFLRWTAGVVTLHIQCIVHPARWSLSHTDFKNPRFILAGLFLIAIYCIHLTPCYMEWNMCFWFRAPSGAAFSLLYFSILIFASIGVPNEISMVGRLFWSVATSRIFHSHYFSLGRLALHIDLRRVHCWKFLIWFKFHPFSRILIVSVSDVVVFIFFWAKPMSFLAISHMDGGWDAPPLFLLLVGAWVWTIIDVRHGKHVTAEKYFLHSLGSFMRWHYSWEFEVNLAMEIAWRWM